MPGLFVPPVGNGGSSFLQKGQEFSRGALNSYASQQPERKTEVNPPGLTAGGAVMAGAGMGLAGYAAAGMSGGAVSGPVGAGIGAGLGILSYLMS